MPSYESDGAARAVRILLVLSALFIVYGSFIPFQLTTEPALVQRHLAAVKLLPFDAGRRTFSIPDVVSNVLLYIPFGLFLAASGFGEFARFGRVLLCGLIGAALSIAIELGQLFTLDRTTSAVDVMCNTAGTMLGAAMADAVVGALQGPAGERVTALVRRRPIVLAIALLSVAIMADRFYPFSITIDVSTVWHSVKSARWRPFGTFQGRFWADVLMDIAVPLMLLAALLKTALARVGSGSAAVAAWLLTVVFSAALEAGKIFFAGRVPNIDSVILAGLGGLLGVTSISAIAGWQRGRVRPGAVLLALAVALLAYAELKPFDFTLAPDLIAAKARGIEWLPFRSYYGAEPRSVLYDLWTKLLLSGFVGFAWANATRRGPWAAASAGVVVGLVLEAGQIFEVPRGPGITDVLLFGIGAHAGGLAHEWHRRWHAAGELS